MDLFDYVRNKAMLVLVFTCFHTMLVCVSLLGKLVFGKSTFVFKIPGHCYGSSKNGPYGPQGPWAQC